MRKVILQVAVGLEQRTNMAELTDHKIYPKGLVFLMYLVKGELSN